MGSFKIIGGKRLKGEVIPQGAKNEALQILCAVLLTKEPVTIHNIPDIVDVNKLIDLLGFMGVQVEKLGEGSYKFIADNVDVEFFLKPQFKTLGGGLRGSVMVVGPTLARFGKGYIPTPGGDKIGRRRLDTHFIGFEKLGADISYDKKEGFFKAEAKRLKGTYMLLDESSVTGTANIVMAAVLAEGRTTIFNAACEPYLQQLCDMLVRMGAKISGIGSNLLHIDGVDELGGTEHRMLPDMIEIGSFIGLAAMTRSSITIKDVQFEKLGVIPDIFRRLGITVVQQGDDIHVPAQEHYTITKFLDGSNLTVSDAPWPGFTPDLLSIVLVTAIQAKGSVLVHQKMFESRLFFVDKLIEMGAQITLCDPHRALVIGNDFQSPLRAIRMTSPDIRAGVALLIAALSAEGTSTIDNIEQIDRGYQNIEARLKALGAQIERV
ncbi:MAG: UDP-N-acetylglucosamine 1-carboxyvinyltransferase [Flavobacteriales bacterium]|nr:UDP-N-acetylglucosamine 1-carboxyvinyltransferase [Flavobacteriales bacterium]MBK6946542.1 UDP-N-acetylglucosamine 1-carboxyvinyltransferase [Flavobacteriales bacterium]MBK7239719.1 UDP-N-acetylglucosamine 1-carboxyvinyltransferase [Flavobacteriales bacterium]MBK9536593.1 UDP-N-acetylglucosamine 1-carboxyvinyltransferase [Flavobacteriales bacterium]MBP9139379.1 UDP-N-acetylglucosamine 1-carboxyvinyltransferase [Flavobacteriales bacterium]